ISSSPPAVPSRGSVTQASSTIRADIVSSVRRSAASACVARGDVLISATGLPGNSRLATSQSSAFFITPATPRAYSGLEISRRSPPPMTARNPATGAGTSAPSRSGLKNGRPAIPSNSTTLTPAGASRAAARSAAVLLEPLRRLPEIATIFMRASALVRLVPIGGRACIDLQRQRQVHRRERRVLHHLLHHGQGRGDLAVRHFEDQFVMHLQQHLRGQLLLGERVLDTDHGAADDVGRGALQARVDRGAFVEGADRGV